MPGSMKDRIGRRDFLKKATAGAALGAATAAMGATAVDTSKIRSYNPEMEYRPLGDTGIMVSAVCLGGHWKRVNLVAPGCFEGGN
ncbi:MAG: twin-arginine translocation signal domain-containing protein, partial [Armatimonadota bacterium]